MEPLKTPATWEEEKALPSYLQQTWSPFRPLKPDTVGDANNANK